jgi:hypothetical protein
VPSQGKGGKVLWEEFLLKVSLKEQPFGLFFDAKALSNLANCLCRVERQQQQPKRIQRGGKSIQCRRWKALKQRAAMEFSGNFIPRMGSHAVAGWCLRIWAVLWSFGMPVSMHLTAFSITYQQLTSPGIVWYACSCGIG